MNDDFCFNNHILVKDISLMYTAITKSASTVMRYSIAKHLKLVSDTDSKENLDLAISKYNQLRIATLKNKMLAKNRLLIVRDPVERLVSTFLDRIVKKKTFNLKEFYRTTADINVDLKTFNFDNFLRILPNIYNLDKHFFSQSEYILPNFKYNLIFNLKKFGELIKNNEFYKITKLKIIDINSFSDHHLSKCNLKEINNANKISIVELRNLLKKKIIPSYKNFINSQNIKIIENIYQEDYKNFSKYF